jgi:hypothetical protein
MDGVAHGSYVLDRRNVGIGQLGITVGSRLGEAELDSLLSA